jgi:AraC-like DNA-binding protein
VRTVWRAFAEEDADYVDDASEHWGLSFIRGVDGELAAELAGPRIEGLPIRGHRGESYWGVELAAHVMVPGVDKALLRGAIARLPAEGGYADQSHLTRELRRIRGETPARILAATHE